MQTINYIVVAFALLLLLQGCTQSQASSQSNQTAVIGASGASQSSVSANTASTDLTPKGQLLHLLDLQKKNRWEIVLGEPDSGRTIRFLDENHFGSWVTNFDPSDPAREQMSYEINGESIECDNYKKNWTCVNLGADDVDEIGDAYVLAYFQIDPNTIETLDESDVQKLSDRTMAGVRVNCFNAPKALYGKDDTHSQSFWQDQKLEFCFSDIGAPMLKLADGPLFKQQVVLWNVTQYSTEVESTDFNLPAAIE